MPEGIALGMAAQKAALIIYLPLFTAFVIVVARYAIKLLCWPPADRKRILIDALASVAIFILFAFMAAPLFVDRLTQILMQR